MNCSHFPTKRHSRQRGLILVVVLVMITLLALLAASYTFLVRSNLHAIMAAQDQFQARMAAESGIQRAVVMLRGAKNDPAVWYDNPGEFHRRVVYGETRKGPFEEQPVVEGYNPNAPPTWRFNLVGANPDNRATIRYGLTDECSKLSLNVATEGQLRRFFQVALAPGAANVNMDVLVDSILDWRSAGDVPRRNGAKTPYYQSRRPPYRCKSAPFSTIEELLLVRGFNAWLLFGEDYNRNGLLDPNEDDGDASFPPDDGNGVLYPGIAPYLTLWSTETNTSKDGRPRINLNMQDAQKLQDQMAQEFPPQLVDYVAQVRAAGKAFNSVMNLLPAPPKPEQDEEEPSTTQPSTSQPSTSQPTSRPGQGLDASRNGQSSDQNQSGSEKSPAKPPLPEYKDLTETPPPGTYEDLPVILDRLTVQPVPMYAGRINISTAPREVLAALEELTEPQVMAIAAARGGIEPAERSTPAWLMQRQVIDEYTFRRILEKITTHASVFQIEAVGFGDHVGAVERLNMIVEMRGPIAQVLYYRNLTALGAAYTPHIVEERGATNRTNMQP